MSFTSLTKTFLNIVAAQNGESLKGLTRRINTNRNEFLEWNEIVSFIGSEVKKEYLEKKVLRSRFDLKAFLNEGKNFPNFPFSIEEYLRNPNPSETVTPQKTQKKANSVLDRSDRNSSKWRIRAAQMSRSIYQ